jgi:hypothetical protein
VWKKRAVFSKQLPSHAPSILAQRWHSAGEGEARRIIIGNDTVGVGDVNGSGELVESGKQRTVAGV